VLISCWNNSAKCSLLWWNSIYKEYLSIYFL